jgi:hypothetical protein
MLAKTGVAVLPVTGVGIPGTEFPYAVVNPQLKLTVVERLLAVTVPFNCAEEVVTLDGGLVTTMGGPAVEKVISFPLEVPPALTPTTL